MIMVFAIHHFTMSIVWILMMMLIYTCKPFVTWHYSFTMLAKNMNRKELPVPWITHSWTHEVYPVIMCFATCYTPQDGTPGSASWFTICYCCWYKGRSEPSYIWWQITSDLQLNWGWFINMDLQLTSLWVQNCTDPDRFSASCGPTTRAQAVQKMIDDGIHR